MYFITIMSRDIFVIQGIILAWPLIFEIGFIISIDLTLDHLQNITKIFPLSNYINIGMCTGWRYAQCNYA